MRTVKTVILEDSTSLGFNLFQKNRFAARFNNGIQYYPLALVPLVETSESILLFCWNYCIPLWRKSTKSEACGVHYSKVGRRRLPTGRVGVVTDVATKGFFTTICVLLKLVWMSQILLQIISRIKNARIRHDDWSTANVEYDDSSDVSPP